jgi:hypothetical protein
MKNKRFYGYGADVDFEKLQLRVAFPNVKHYYCYISPDDIPVINITYHDNKKETRFLEILDRQTIIPSDSVTTITFEENRDERQHE